MSTADEARVGSLDELIRLARTLLAGQPGDPQVAALLRRIAASSGNSLWQEVVEQLIREPAPKPSTGLGAVFRPVGTFLHDNVWEYLRTRAGVAMVTAVAAGGGGWWAARESPKPDLVRRADAQRVLSDTAADVQQIVFEPDGRVKVVKPEQVKAAADRGAQALRDLPAP